ncbi:MAG: hypothetical protein ACTSWN_16075 [Promethearchaeota archaeon]
MTEHSKVSRDNRVLIERSVELLKEAIAEVAEEDVLDYIDDEGFLVPIHYSWIVERLRERIHELKARELAAINRAEKAEAEKTRLEEEKRKLEEEMWRLKEEKRKLEEEKMACEERKRIARERYNKIRDALSKLLKCHD